MGRPIFNKRHKLPPDLQARLEQLVDDKGLLPVARLLGTSVPVIEELQTDGGGCTEKCRDRVAEALKTLEVAS